MNDEKPVTNSIKTWAEDDRPREKMASNGAAALSNSELLAILIASGTKEKSAVEVAKEILRLGDNDLNKLGKLSLNDLKKVKGIGQAKAITITAALELGRRRHSDIPKISASITNSKMLADYFISRLKDLAHEEFHVAYLSQSNKILKMESVSRGGITGTVADPRIILGNALEVKATGIVLCHNHPSGNLKPSRADTELTQKLKQAASFMDIRVLDHLIVSEEGYFSFADDGIL